MNTNQLISGQKYIFIMSPIDGKAVGLLPIVETALYLSSMYRKDEKYIRVRRDDNSTYLIRCDEIHEIEEEVV